MVWHMISPSITKIEKESSSIIKLIRYRNAVKMLDEKIQTESIPRVRLVLEKARMALLKAQQEYILHAIMKR